MTVRPLLEITDGVTTIDLLDPLGILLFDWIPSVPEPKSGGVWSDSPLFEGRKLAYRQLGNIVDTFELKIRGSSQDNAIYKLQELRRLLEKAIAYWTSDSQNSPVYLRARAAFETNVRFCTIFDYRTPRDSAIFKQPFFNCNPLVDDFLLAIEHGLWQDNVPGDGNCVEIGATQAYAGLTTRVSSSPAQMSDDCLVQVEPTTIDLNHGPGVGYINSPPNTFHWGGGVRFVNMAIPNGATIVSATIYMTNYGSINYSPANALIKGEDVDDAATFSTYANFAGRARTTAQVSWNNIPYGVDGLLATTPDISPVIQEIVNRGGWANGNDLVVFFEDNGSAQNAIRVWSGWEEPYGGPTLYVDYITSGSITFGQEATCNPGEVFVSNKHNRANLTHVFIYDAPAYSGNLIGAATPFAFLPAVPAANDAVYFGISTGLGDSGPFCSLVFDISTVQVNLTTITWQYYNGGWVTLTVQDNTATTDPFDRTGVNSVHWVQPSDWAAVAINGVTAFWVRALVSVVGASPAPPTQANRDIYTIVWPYVDLQSDQVGGDIPAIARIIAANKSDAPSGLDPTLFTSRLIVGSRSLDRGADFSAYLNISDEQNNVGVTVTLGANTAYSNNPATPTGRRAVYTSPGAVGTTTEVTITLDSVLSQEYFGRYRAFLRYKYNTGTADAVSMRLIATPGGSGLAKYSDYVFPQNNLDQQVADFGIVNIPPRSPGDEYGTITFAIEITRDTSGRVIYLYDLILMPVDEWSTDAVDESGLAGRTGAVGNGDMLDIDSVTYPRQVDQAILRTLSTGRMIGYFQNRQPGPALLQSNAAQRLWFLALMYESGTELSSPISIAHTVRMYCAQRYLSARGRR